jgi:hypothetical protein
VLKSRRFPFSAIPTTSTAIGKVADLTLQILHILYNKEEPSGLIFARFSLGADYTFY